MGGNVDVLSLAGVQGNSLLESNAVGLGEMVVGGRAGDWTFYASHGSSFMPPSLKNFPYKLDYRFLLGREVGKLNLFAGLVSSLPLAMGEPYISKPYWGVQGEVALPLSWRLLKRPLGVSLSLSPRVGMSYYPVLGWRKGQSSREVRNVLRLHLRTMLLVEVGR